MQVPSVLNRFTEIPSTNGKDQLLLLENVISILLTNFLLAITVLSVTPFRITRNADLTIHEEGARDLLMEIEKELKKRKWGAAVRLEMQEGMMDQACFELIYLEVA